MRSAELGFTIVELIILIVIVAIVAVIAIPGLRRSRAISNYGNAEAFLKTIAIAEWDFRANDRDGDRVQNFWTGDVAGLYCIRAGPSPSAPSIKLIHLDLAAADINYCPGYSPSIVAITTQAPSQGYWFQALRQDLEVGETYGQKGGAGGSVSGNYFHKERFGFVAYPNSFPSGGRSAGILNENSFMFRRPLSTHVLPVLGQDFGRDYCDWPADATLKTFWTKH